ncbi:hypothetical protein GCM10009555_024110 [Acrocarpospora macrocephala]|uniref:Uncharacterized protein n=1 Tax=Acrocarpospora macrocephala TaxID=150177 RepID=A0A5M3X0U2_9ACTN|nr:hypothetical protein [Acrocarpospora macrocephala]GES12343.1 hypothetical protein Amac_059400 [Acrocarpospora macrocephala]
MSVYPAGDQWARLISHGFEARFGAMWVEGDDPEGTAHELRADPATRLDCDLQTAMRWYQADSRRGLGRLRAGGSLATGTAIHALAYVRVAGVSAAIHGLVR